MVGHQPIAVDGVEQQNIFLPLPEMANVQQAMYEWDATQSYPKDQSLSSLFELQVERTPMDVAFIFDGQTLSYRELNERANQVAHYLRRLGVKPEVRVGLCVERSLEMIIGLLAILKAGGAYVPLDPVYPEERLAFMLADAQITILVTQQRYVQILPACEHILCLDTAQPLISQESKANCAVQIEAEQIAYVIYTSGSTGRPKGVLGTHRAALNRFQWMWNTYPFQPRELCCQKTALSFVDSVWEIFGPLLQGVCTVIIPDLIVKNPRQLLHILQNAAITRIVLVPSLLQALLDSLENLKSAKLHLRYCISSGEALPLDLALRFMKSVPQCTLLNLYGSSEVAADATCYDVTHASSHEHILIGKPIANMRAYLLDTHLQPVPVGAIGELYIGGDGLARGYFNRPDLTAAAFLPDPFGGEPGARLYKTGDLARYLPDGNLEYRGRLDHQVKILGMRIELGEIEHVLALHPVVRDVVVMAREMAAGEKRLVAYVVFHQGQTATSHVLQEHILLSLPSYMLPNTFVYMDELPLTPNGKVDRLALPIPNHVRSEAEIVSLSAPISSIHQQLQQIWETLLDVHPIGITENFFHLGGHSFLAARLVSQIELAFGKTLSLATLFAHPTIEQLALALEKEEQPSQTPLVAVQPGGHKRPFFYLHGAWNSDAFYCFYLAQYLGPDQPFYALAPYNFGDLHTIPSIEEMATAHIQAVRAVQPEGPYLLGGFCNGGLVAYEMARQLQASGQSIEALILIEPAYSPPLHILARSVITRLGTWLHLSHKQQATSFLRVRHFYKYLLRQVTMENIKSSRIIDPGILTLFPTTHALLLDDNSLLDWIIAGYSYPPYHGNINLIWAHEEAFRGIWREKAAQEKAIQLRIIPGTHIGCRTDHVQSLAEELGRSLSQVEALKKQ
jgi:amino acid adenylation domain-containing protein